jgi:hypothetical protein
MASKKCNPSVWGTSYFASKGAAIRYYKPYGYDKEAVESKIRQGEIHIGRPPVKPGQTLKLIDGATRFAIVENPSMPIKAKKVKGGVEVSVKLPSLEAAKKLVKKMGGKKK